MLLLSSFVNLIFENRPKSDTIFVNLIFENRPKSDTIGCHRVEKCNVPTSHRKFYAYILRIVKLIWRKIFIYVRIDDGHMIYHQKVFLSPHRYSFVSSNPCISICLHANAKRIWWAFLSRALRQWCFKLRVLAKNWVSRGFKCQKAMLTRTCTPMIFVQKNIHLVINFKSICCKFQCWLDLRN